MEDFDVVVLSQLAALAKLVLAGACGAAVGWEREAHEKAAGLRTHILLAVGACLFAIVSQRIAALYTEVDMLRVVQGALLGTGFICAGVIFREGHSVRGLTTAAGLWIMGAVGLAVGMGEVCLGLVTTGLTFVAMTVLRRGKRRIQRRAAEGEPEEPMTEGGPEETDRA